MQGIIDGEENARLGEKNSRRAEKIGRKKKKEGKRKGKKSRKNHPNSNENTIFSFSMIIMAWKIGVEGKIMKFTMNKTNTMKKTLVFLYIHKYKTYKTSMWKKMEAFETRAGIKRTDRGWGN